MKMIKCKKCGMEHAETTCNCCWIYCDCGEKICGQCGGSNIEHDNSTSDDEDSDDMYWCCQRCDDCGLGGCAMCV